MFPDHRTLIGALGLMLTTALIAGGSLVGEPQQHTRIVSER